MSFIIKSSKVASPSCNKAGFDGRLDDPDMPAMVFGLGDRDEKFNLDCTTWFRRLCGTEEELLIVDGPFLDVVSFLLFVDAFLDDV